MSARKAEYWVSGGKYEEYTVPNYSLSVEKEKSKSDLEDIPSQQRIHLWHRGGLMYIFCLIKYISCNIFTAILIIYMQGGGGEEKYGIVVSRRRRACRISRDLYFSSNKFFLCNARRRRSSIGEAELFVEAKLIANQRAPPSPAEIQILHRSSLVCSFGWPVNYLQRVLLPVFTSPAAAANSEWSISNAHMLCALLIAWLVCR